MVRDRYTPEDKDLVLPSDGIIYIGDPFTDGSWRKIRVNNDWHAQRRESGSWVNKSGDTA